jgi:threonine dehydrogenase-like Zn-dependent dehydrogenase
LPEKRSDGSDLRDDDALFLGDNLATAWSTARHAGIREGDVVAVIGCGPVGLLAVLSALTLGASAVVAADGVAYRREKAGQLGASQASPEMLRRVVADLTDGRGADAVLEAVGNPQALDLAIQVARPGAVISVAGYHTESTFALSMRETYTKNLTLRFGRASARAEIEGLLPLLIDGRLKPADIVTHRMPLQEGVRGYEMFRRREDGAIKVLLLPGD